MPEVILPCPMCGREPKVNRGCGVVTCCEIAVDDVGAWNSLPRALRWTHEPPKVEGWYFQRAMGKEKTQRIAFVSATLSGLHCKCGCSSRPLAHWVGFEWAGPIPPPID